MYGRADGMPSFQLTMAVREKMVVLSHVIAHRHNVKSSTSAIVVTLVEAKAIVMSGTSGI
jgi:hypothetical protein